LKRLFTQNVDTLERMAGLPEEMLVEAHGSFATAHCLNCRQEYRAEELRPRIAKGEILRCDKPSCKKSMKGLIKSDIVCECKTQARSLLYMSLT
jgi:NAD-dependent SIR2 family protein deacetylase